MREIKFRAWDGDSDMSYFVNLYCDDEFSGCWWAADYIDQDSGNKFGSFDAESGGVLMQYTGLKDKNGKEIYEGDIVLYEPDYIKLRQKPAEVRWEDHGWSPFLYSGGGEFEPSYCTVIGNIFEHPELLEK